MNVHRLQQRAAIIQAARFFFGARGYLEVETPIRLPALIPEANILPLSSASWFLQTSPELCMKRLLAVGVPRLFQICKCFRDHERGRRHLPEFTMLEWYCLDGTYLDLMTETQALLQALAEKFKDEVGFDGEVVRLLLELDWQRLTVHDAFARHAPISVDQALADDCFDEILVEYVEPKLGIERPCFLYAYPVSLGSLAKTSRQYPELAERFELYIHGVELANGFSELTDPAEQRRRFVKETELGRNKGVSFGVLPEKFLKDLVKIEAACGIALGMDRLVMLLTGAKDIDEVVSFTPEDL
ncbi:MAG: EF-P lysine aminoacylase GenX [Proteobacteria bacterium]|nr:EF-P lysine aminoacylase GenX [Pseudomonadota bacterium]MBU1640786.1 EF-P lysine aminoacylase GenX [Pseudomonadota bacterium]